MNYICYTTKSLYSVHLKNTEFDRYSEAKIYKYCLVVGERKCVRQIEVSAIRECSLWRIKVVYWILAIQAVTKKFVTTLSGDNRRYDKALLNKKLLSKLTDLVPCSSLQCQHEDNSLSLFFNTN